jgi:hypothetical protein
MMQNQLSTAGDVCLRDGFKGAMYPTHPDTKVVDHYVVDRASMLESLRQDHESRERFVKYGVRFDRQGSSGLWGSEVEYGIHVDHGAVLSIDESCTVFNNRNTVPSEWKTRHLAWRKDYAEKAYATPVQNSSLGIFDVSSKWLLDTGAAKDLVSRSKASKFPDALVDAKNITFMTANGTASQNEMRPLVMRGKGATTADAVEAYVLGECPCVLSVGQRVMEQGYTFIWAAGKRPCLIDSNGKAIVADIEGHVPIRKKGSVARDVARQSVASKSGVNPLHGYGLASVYQFEPSDYYRSNQDESENWHALPSQIQQLFVTTPVVNKVG